LGLRVGGFTFWQAVRAVRQYYAAVRNIFRQNVKCLLTRYRGVANVARVPRSRTERALKTGVPAAARPECPLCESAVARRSFHSESGEA